MTAYSTLFPPVYRGSVKEVLGPVPLQSPASASALIFQYSDAYSVFDWGRMPDLLQGKGEALAVLAASWFERLGQAETWKEFSRSPVALGLRKANRFGALFNEVGEKLQRQGLGTHHLGALPAEGAAQGLQPSRLAELSRPTRHLLVRQVSVVKPMSATILGRAVPDYSQTRTSPLPRLVPLEVVFRFSCPEGSSLLDRVESDPQYLVSRGFGEANVSPGTRWEFPVLEMFTKLEASDRPVSLGEALAISGLSARELENLLLTTAWVAGFLKQDLSLHGLELADGKVEWAVSESGELMLVDAVGPDELRILKNGVQLSKEFLRKHYRETPWYQAVGQAKSQAQSQGIADWKRLVAQPPPALPAEKRELARQVYLALANEVSGRRWFADAWPLARVVEELSRVAGVGSGPGASGGGVL